MNSEVIILLSTVSTGVLALFGLCVRYAFLSKCIHFKCCCCELERDIRLENINNVNNGVNNENLTQNNNNIV